MFDINRNTFYISHMASVFSPFKSEALIIALYNSNACQENYEDGGKTEIVQNNISISSEFEINDVLNWQFMQFNEHWKKNLITGELG